MWSISSTSKTWVRLTSTIEGLLFGLHVLEVGWGLSLVDKAYDGVLHAAYGNFLLLMFL